MAYKKQPYLSPDGVVKYALPLVKGSWIDKKGGVHDEPPTDETIYLGPGRVEVYRVPLEPLREPVFTAMSCWITAYAREKTCRSAQANYDRFIYADTDSLKLLGYEEPVGLEVHDTHLGAWKDEGDFTYSKWIRAKTYMVTVKQHTKKRTLKAYAEVMNQADSLEVIHLEDDGIHYLQTKVTCAGMPDNVKQEVTYDTFCSGSVFDGKLVPHRVRGGVILEDTTFSIL